MQASLEPYPSTIEKNYIAYVRAKALGHKVRWDARNQEFKCVNCGDRFYARNHTEQPRHVVHTVVQMPPRLPLPRFDRRPAYCPLTQGAIFDES